MKKINCLYSFIIVARKGSDLGPCVDSLSKLSTKYSYEIILALGNNPSFQRNMAAKQAKGEILIFLDNDSVVSPFLLDHYHFIFENYPQGDCVGGPSCLLKASNQLEMAIDLVFTSDFGLGPVKARYYPFGAIRKAGEKDLILCNLAVKKSAFEKVGGFDNNLHPNEENAFLNELSKHCQIYYHPLAIVYRGHRKNIREYILQMMSYGSGRIKHYKLHAEFFNQIYLIPLFFFLYMTGLLLALILGSSPLVMFAPIVFYFLLITCSTVIGIFRTRNIKTLYYAPLLFFICHYFYGLGEFLEILRIFSKEKKDGKCQIINHRTHIFPEEIQT